MAEFELRAEPRTVTGKKVRRLRAQGYVPAVLYGHDTAPVKLQLAERDLVQTLRGAGTTSLISLEIGSGGEKRTTLVRDVQYDPIRRTVQHVDFYQVVMAERISTEVGIVLVGEAGIEVAGYGAALQQMNAVEIECLPGDLISTIELDISPLAATGDTLTVKDLVVPAGITILAGPDEIVATTHLFRAEMEPEEVPVEAPLVEPAEQEGAETAPETWKRG